MPAAGTYQPQYPSLPIAVPAKLPYHAVSQPARQSPCRSIATTAPSAGSSVAASAVPSLTTGDSVQDDHDSSSGGARGVDLIDMMTDRLSIAVNPIPMDKSIAKQAQTSGELNAKQRELAELQALAQRRLGRTRANLADGMKAAKEVRKDLEWTQKRVSSLNAKAAAKHPSAYKQASAKYPSPADL